jgi:DNA invertase Pin-like site-specific DNA recombinase
MSDFQNRIDKMLLAGVSTQAIAREFGIRERGVRRRKGSLLAQGFTINLRGQAPGAEDASFKE